MKPMLLAALLAAIASSALTALFLSAARPPEPDSPGLAAADLKAALGDVERELAAIRLELRRRETAPQPARPAGAPAPAEKEPEVRGLPSGEPSSGEPEPARLREPGLALTPPPEYDRLEVLHGWKTNPELRRSWMFRTEAEVLEAFGTPDLINSSGVEENWIYHRPTNSVDPLGNPIVNDMVLKLNRGRLVAVYD